jgi:hypothetical protein
MQEALEENRQHLVRALRAVELSTAETREESSAAVERVVELEAALDVQAQTVRDLREQVYALQLRSQRSADERVTHQHSQELALLAGRLARLEEAAPPVEERVAGCETLAGEVQVGLENLGSWVQSTIQQRAVEYERQLSMMNISMQSMMNTALESASERIYHQIEVSSERLDPDVAELKQSVVHLQDENANLREQVSNSQAALPSELTSPGTTPRIEGASPRVKEEARPKSPPTPREASKDVVAADSSARDQLLTATVDKVRPGVHIGVPRS